MRLERRGGPAGVVVAPPASWGRAGKGIALSSCKWSENVHPAGELDKLKTVTGMLADADLLASAHPPLLLFDRTGFSPRLAQIAAGRADVHLIELDPLIDPEVRILLA